MGPFFFKKKGGGGGKNIVRHFLQKYPQSHFHIISSHLNVCNVITVSNKQC